MRTAVRMAMVAMALATPLGAAAMAQSIEAGPLIACAAKPDDAERLACYDRALDQASAAARAAAQGRQAAAAQARAARAAADARAAAAAAATAETAKRAAFGRETLPMNQRPSSYEGQLDALSAKVSEVLLNQATGRAVFVLDNGMMWRQTDGMDMPPVRPGSDVTVKRGLVGSYRLTVPKIRRTITVVRLR